LEFIKGQFLKDLPASVQERIIILRTSAGAIEEDSARRTFIEITSFFNKPDLHASAAPVW
jgi:hypothetical protein